MARILVIPYDPSWPIAFDAAAREVSTAFGNKLLALHHIGSTSIPGLHAKPVIDMLAVVADITAVDRIGPAMEQLGYEVMGEFGIPGRRYFRRDNTQGARTHQIHTFQQGSRHIDRHLAFRDYLRAHPETAAQYADLKQKLATAHPHDMSAYMDGKDAFIKQVERHALQWKRDASQRHAQERTPKPPI